MTIAVIEALSIIGFVDLEVSRHLELALTTVRVRAEKRWAPAADRLIEGLTQQPIVTLEVQTELELLVATPLDPSRAN